MAIRLENIKGKSALLFSYILTGIAIFLISLLFPNNLKFKYEFEKGQPWIYPDLASPIDFPILKKEVDYQLEIEQIKSNFSPYYEVSSKTNEAIRNDFEQIFSDSIQSNDQHQSFLRVYKSPEKYLALGLDVLNQIIDNGIVKVDDLHKSENGGFVFQILNGNVQTKRTKESIIPLDRFPEIVLDSLLNRSVKESEFLIPILSNPSLYRYNTFFNNNLTSQFLNEYIDLVPQSEGFVKKGDLIITNGTILNDELYHRLYSFKEKYLGDVSENKNNFALFSGYLVLTSLTILLFLAIIWGHKKEILQNPLQWTFFLMWIVVFSYLIYLLETNILSAYLLPYCIVPIIVKKFYDEKIALFTHITIILTASFLSNQGYAFTFLQLLAGIVAVYVNFETRNWASFFWAIFYILCTYLLGNIGLTLIKEGDFLAIDFKEFAWLFWSVFLTLLAYPLIPLFERIFGFTSSITLMELTDMNRPLLKELSLKAAGTFQHSLQVANLAEAAAQKIGANELLVKVAALYHDIGKIKNPQYFIENTSGTNLHESLTALESAKIIIKHASDGVEMAKKHRLPVPIIDIIRSHHGTTRVEYFYRTHVNEFGIENTDANLFTYPGPKPKNKEEAILMMADSIEAATKSLKNPSQSDIDTLADKIVRGKIEHGQLDDCNLSFKELQSCLASFKRSLHSIYHIRVEYPK